MKKKNIALALLTTLCLMSCNETSNDDLRIFKHQYDDGSYFKTYKENKDSDTDVYVYTVLVRNETNEEKEFQASDFSLKVNGQDYTCLYFVVTYQFSSIKINGELTSFAYIVETRNVEKIQSVNNHLENILCAFSINDGNNYNISYQNNILKSLGE